VPHRVAQRFIGNIHRRFHAELSLRSESRQCNVPRMSIPIFCKMEAAIR
jgi:hypothetical protein